MSKIKSISKKRTEAEILKSSIKYAIQLLEKSSTGNKTIAISTLKTAICQNIPFEL